MDELMPWRDLASTAQKMARLAQANEWDQLADTFRQFEVVLARLGTTSGSRTLSRAEAEGKAELIQSILSDFATIKACVGPWMQDVRPMLDAWVINRIQKR